MLEPFNQKQDVELVVTPVGNAMILYRGTLEAEYSWAQYEPVLRRVELVTVDGLVQPLGFEIHDSMALPLRNTREIMLVQMNDDNSVAGGRLIKFTALGE